MKEKERSVIFKYDGLQLSATSKQQGSVRLEHLFVVPKPTAPMPGCEVWV